MLYFCCMKISYNWLKEYIAIDLPAVETGKLLTSGGLEVEEINTYESIAGSLDKVIVGEVLTKEKHPDADKLSVTTVNTGTEVLQIVCGAPNVAAGQKVIVALVGSTLQTVDGEKINIKKSKIRGIESHGMICAEDEIGLGHSHDGIMILAPETTVGMPAAEYFNIVKDEVIEIGLTPNRGDAYSHIGTARDVKALLATRLDKQIELQYPTRMDMNKATLKNPIQIQIENAAKCKRYAGVYLENIVVQDSPEWIQNRLKAIGVRPINNVVDITNYILHEYGQPLHAFDTTQISNHKIIVRDAKEAETFITLDDKKINLVATDLVIADTDKSLCIAGVYGSNNSGVKATTTKVFLESAHFDSTSLRITGTKHLLRTDASMHFEKGIDINKTVEALERAIYLLVESNPNLQFSAIDDHYAQVVEKTTIVMSYAHIQRLIGVTIEPNIIHRLLKALDFELSEINELGFIAHVPTCKTEVTREADVIEEILRIYGFDKIPVSTDIYSTVSYREKPDKTLLENQTAQFLTANGFYEMMSNPISQSNFYEADAPLVKLMNSMTAELDVMRADLIYGALESISYNMNRKNNRLRLFEWGQVFEKNEEQFNQKTMLGIYMSGPVKENSWNSQSSKSSLFDIKSYVEEICNRHNVGDMQMELQNNQSHYSSSIIYKKGEKVVAHVGIVKKQLTQKFDIKEEVLVAFLDWKQILQGAKKKQIKYKAVSKFPTVKRDMAWVVDKSCLYESLKKTSEKVLKNLLKEQVLFDVYEGDKIQNHQKSYAISYTLGDDSKTLLDKDIDAMMQKLVKTMQEEHGAEIRQ